MDKVNSKFSLRQQQGFSLLEVMIALTVFAVFSTMYVTSQSSNLADSIQIREESLLRNLCLDKINQVINDPPELRDALTISKEEKTFDDFPDYKFTLEWKKLKVPGTPPGGGKADGEEAEATNEDGSASNSAIKALIAKNIKDNLENLLWQLQVTVTNKKTGFFYTLSSWIMNKNATVKIEGI